MNLGALRREWSLRGKVGGLVESLVLELRVWRVVELLPLEARLGSVGMRVKVLVLETVGQLDCWIEGLWGI